MNFQMLKLCNAQNVMLFRIKRLAKANLRKKTQPFVIFSDTIRPKVYNLFERNTPSAA